MTTISNFVAESSAHPVSIIETRRTVHRDMRLRAQREQLTILYCCLNHLGEQVVRSKLGAIIWSDHPSKSGDVLGRIGKRDRNSSIV